MTKIAILGTGGWGTALAVLWARHGLDVLLWGTPSHGSKRSHGAERMPIISPPSRFPETSP